MTNENGTMDFGLTTKTMHDYDYDSTMTSKSSHNSIHYNTNIPNTNLCIDHIFIEDSQTKPRFWPMCLKQQGWTQCGRLLAQSRGWNQPEVTSED